MRRQDPRSQRLHDAGAEIFVDNQDDYRDMCDALKDVQRAYVCPPPGPNTAHFGAVFVAAAHEARLDHVVVLSQWLSAPDHVATTTREAWLLDRLVDALPDTTHTINDMGFFADNYFSGLAATAQLGKLTVPLGPPELKGNAPPSNNDVAALTVACLADPAAHAGRRYRPTGPGLLSNAQIAETIGQALGRNVSYANAPEWMFLRALSWASFMQYDPPEPIADNTKPVLYAAGEKDPNITPEVLQMVAATIGGPVRGEIFPDGVHQLVLFETEAFSNLVHEFCTGVIAGD